MTIETLSQEWALYVRDADLFRVGRIGTMFDFEAKLQYCDVSTWGLTIPYTLADPTDDIPAVNPILADMLAPGAGIELTYHGQVVISGPVTGLQRVWGQRNDEVVFAGVSDDVWLLWRQAHQMPAASAPDGSRHYTQAFDVRTGVAETIMRAYVNVNAGPGAIVARRVPGLSLDTDLARGPTLTGRARMPMTLLELLQPLAEQAGLGFSIRQSGTALVFMVDVPIDRTAEVRFGRAFANVSGYEFGHLAPDATYAYVGGDGDNAARVFVLVDDGHATTPFGSRVETFVDGGATTDVTELTQKANEGLLDHAASDEAKVSPRSAIENVRFIDDWNLGDRVTVVIDGEAYAEPVRVVDLKMDKTGVHAEPDITNAPQGTTLAARDSFVETQVRRLARRVGALERR